MRGIPLATPATPVAEVEAAIAAADGRGGRRNVGGTTDFLSSPLSPALRRLGLLYALYLCFASLRVQEVITALAIPKLPMIMSLVLVTGLVLTVPGAGWSALWQATPALRWQALLVFLAVVTVPLGIWVGNSLDQLYPGYFISVTVFVAGIVILRDRTGMVTILRVLLTTLAVLTCLVVLRAGGQQGGQVRIGLGSSLDANDYAWILATFVPVALWFGVRRKATSIFWFGIAALLTLGVAHTQSRGGFLALIAVALVLITLGATGWRRVVMFVGIGVLGAGLLAYINATGASRLTDFSGYTGGTGRTELWKQGIRWMVQRPWGYGMGNYATQNVWSTRDYHSGHSAYVNVGVELGVLGAVAFLAIWYGAVRGVLSARQKALSVVGRPGADEEATLLGYVLAMMAGNMVGSAFINTQFAALTLFVQALGTAAWLGSSFSGATPVAAAADAPDLPRHRSGGTALRPAPAGPRPLGQRRGGHS